MPNSMRSTGFCRHAWAVTVTGAPKLWAIRFIEEQERSARRWYGGAIGRVTFDGNMNTGLTLRTIRMKDGIGEVRAGATLLYDSDPQAEEAECRLKASALFGAIRGQPSRRRRSAAGDGESVGRAQGAAGRSRGFVRPHARQLHPHDRRRCRDDAATISRAPNCSAVRRPTSSCCRRDRAGPPISR